MFDPSTHRVFASRDVIFHEQEDEGNKDNNYKIWHILLEFEENKLEEKAKDSKKKKLEEESNDNNITRNKIQIRSVEVLSEKKG